MTRGTALAALLLWAAPALSVSGWAAHSRADEAPASALAIAGRVVPSDGRPGRSVRDVVAIEVR